jgi:hypothetical protein
MWLRKFGALGFGEMTCRPALMPKRLPFALDNGAYGDWVHKRVFNDAAFLEHVELVLLSGFRPDFIVIPDIVAAGLESLRFSLDWLPILKPMVGDVPLYLAVQDGMTLDEVRPHLLSVGGIFVGGTDPWKKSTVATWAELAHENNLLCHLGRAGTYNKVKLARAVGVDSIDSSLQLMSQRFFSEFLAALRSDPHPNKTGCGQLSLWEKDS